MGVFKEPIFTEDELNEVKTGVSIGYEHGMLIPGHDFRNAFTNKVAKKLISAKERINGMAKRRELHEKINSFGWARVDGSKLRFGVKYSSPNGLSQLGKSSVEKYKQLLGFYLEQAGWKNIKVDGYGDYEIPLDYSENVELLYNLSPSIGFYYKAGVPDMNRIEQLKYEAEYKGIQRRNTQPEKIM